MRNKSRKSSEHGRAYLGAMRAAANCALANRQILAHLAREAFVKVFGKVDISLLYDVSHNNKGLISGGGE